MANIQLLSADATLEDIYNAINQILEVLRRCPCPCDEDCDCRTHDCRVDLPNCRTGTQCIQDRDECVCVCLPPVQPCEDLRCNPPNLKVAFRIFNTNPPTPNYIGAFAGLVNKMTGNPNATCCNGRGFNGTTWGFPCGVIGSDAYVNACVRDEQQAAEISRKWNDMGSSGITAHWVLDDNWEHRDGYFCRCLG